MTNRLILLARFDRNFRHLIILRWLIWLILFVFLVLGILSSEGIRQTYFGSFFIVLPFGILLDLFRLFTRGEIGREEMRQVKSLTQSSMTYATASLIERSNGKSQRLWQNLFHDAGLTFVLNRLGCPTSSFRNQLTTPPDYKTWVKTAEAYAFSLKQPLAPEHFFEVVQSTENLTAIWQSLGISFQDRKNVWSWWYRVESSLKQSSRGISDTLLLSGGIGKDWSSGYTHSLEMYAVNITSELQRYAQDISLVGRRDERKKILEYLSRDRQHNTLIIGEDGIGKERLVLAIASDFIHGRVPVSLKYKHVYRLDVGRIISGGSSDKVEMILHTVLEEAASVGNIILFIPDLHLLIGGQGNQELGVINASAVLSSFLQSPAIQVIGTISPENYYRFVKPNISLEENLLPVEIHEISAEDALQIVEDESPRYEIKSKCFFTYPSLVKIISIAEQHLHDKPYPEKALQLLDQVAGSMGESGTTIVTAKDVERIVSESLKIPMGNVGMAERDILNNLETMIQSRIVGQNEAVSVVANALRRARAGLHSGKRPIGSFLFLGPTGVGKTEMAKTIAAIYYKNEKSFIRLDMSEYQSPESINKLLGTREETGTLTTAVSDQPFSVVLLDEIEKATPEVRNVFLQILDDGHVTDGYGHKVDFTNAMVIATSNAGAPLIREAVQSGSLDMSFKTRLLDWLQSQGIFTPEWLNRFDAVVTFLPLTREEIKEVAKRQVNELIERLKSHNINLTVEDDVYEVLVERGYDPQFGARPMRRAVQDSIETALAKVLLNDPTEGMKSIRVNKSLLA